MSLDMYDKKPSDMVHYLQYYGWHFNKKMCEWAISRMKHSGKSILTKDKVDALLKQYGVVLEKNELYDLILNNINKCDESSDKSKVFIL